MPTYREWLAFHLDAQRGMFIDEVVPAPGGAGVMIFSQRETEPMWNMLFVFSVRDAHRHQASIARAFALREREPVGYLPDPAEAALPSGWRASGQNAWMSRVLQATDGALPAGLSLKRVITSAQARAFNQLYFDVYWGDSPSAKAARPIPDETAWDGASRGAFEVAHRLLFQGDTPAALLTTICRNGLGAIYNVGTDPRLTRRGYASHAIRATLAVLAGQGVREVFLLTECNPALVPFYARLGFETVIHGQFYRLQAEAE
jgi:ribosomal protein S18 acetylase RimI-like enzyme